MKETPRKLGALFLSAAMLTSLAANAAAADQMLPETDDTHYTAEILNSGISNFTTKKAPPTEFTYPSFSLGSDFKLIFSSADVEWLNAITGVTVDGSAWSEGHVWGNQSYSIVARTNEMDGCYIQIGSGFSEARATCVISAEGYNDLILLLDKEGRTATVVSETPETGVIQVEQIGITEDMFGQEWQFAFDGADGYVSAIQTLSVNGEVWEETNYITSGGQYQKDTEQQRLVLAQKSFGTTPEIQSGDVVTITAENYEDLTFRFIVDEDGNPSAQDPEASGETGMIHVEQIGITEDMFGQEWQFAFDGADGYVSAIQTLSVNGEVWEETNYITSGGQYQKDTEQQRLVLAQKSFGTTPEIQSGDVVTITAENYEDLTFRFIVDEDGNPSAQDPEASGETGMIHVEQIGITEDMFGQDWYFTFADAENYVSAITSVSINGTEWEEKDYISSGGEYKKNTDNNRLVFAQLSFGSIAAIKSGDVITITAENYEDLTFKFIVDTEGNPSAQENDGEGDIYQLHVKLVGSFEAAIVGQKDYDGVSGATGGASVNQNSNVTVYGALVEKGSEPSEEDWDELDYYSSDIGIDGSKCSVSIVPDTDHGTHKDSDSGMEGVYLPISSSLTLNGTPKDPGSYLISITVVDNQGREATSNALPFRIYTGEETLADQLQLENLTQTQDGKYMWDIMEPWAIKNFGSNVVGEENSVRVPAEVKAWFGSHTSGTYGYLGYDIPWNDVLNNNIPQTLYIPSGCDLTFVNMEILSSVRIVVENGGKLTLQDSVVQGIIEVENGGTFSMNYNGYGNQGEFLVGSSICGQLRLEDGAILENASIYSHINYLANGNLTDRTSNEPVVLATGNVTVRGQVFIQGDEAGDNKIGQTGLRVQNGTLTVEDGAVLVVYGGDAKVQLYPTSGTAIQLDNGTITGAGKVVAVAGQAFWGNGGTAVSGTGTISTAQAYLQGATAWTTRDAEAGKAIAGNISVTSPSSHVKDGTIVETLADDPLAELYWKTGIDPMPPLDKFVTEAVVSIMANTTSLHGGGTVTLMVRNAEGDVSVKQTDNQGSAEKVLNPQEDGSYSVSLPNQTAIYTFTVTAENGSARCSVTVSEESTDSSGNNGNGGGNSGKPDISDIEDPDIPLTQMPNFTDVSSGEYYYDAVLWAVANGVTNGTSATTFGPNVTVTRAQMVTFLWRAYGSPETTGANPFTDVSTSDYYYDAVLWAVTNGISSGTSSTTFSPDAPVTRAQAITFQWRAAGSPVVSGSNFDDVAADAYYVNAMTWAVANGITNGTGGNTFSPDAVVTRAQAVTFLWRELA